MTETNNVEIYYPCNDISRPLCRDFINNNCKRGKLCLLYHPSLVTPIHKKHVRRELGHCYCGARQKNIINRNKYKITNDDNNRMIPSFYVVCSKTRKSMKFCM
jgi:hypothetical protein